MKHIYLCSAALLMAAVFQIPAQAQIFVNGDGAPYSCYMSAKNGNPGSVSAIKTCSEALSDPLIRTNKAATYVNRGILYMRKGEYEAASADYEQATTLRPDLPEIYINYGAALFYLQKDEQALEMLNKAVALDTDKMAEALYNRALVLDRQEKLREAYLDLKQALELKPGWEPAERAISQYTVTSRPAL